MFVLIIILTIRVNREEWAYVYIKRTFSPTPTKIFDLFKRGDGVGGVVGTHLHNSIYYYNYRGQE